MDTRLTTALDALEWIATHATDEGVLRLRGSECQDDFHFERPPLGGDPYTQVCEHCCSTWWAADGSSQPMEYVVQAVAARAVRDIEEDDG